jgi:CheY-like chemotaxis protein
MRQQAASQAEEHALRTAAEESSRRSNEFLATLAHELRNPLAPIQNALEIMKLTSKPELLQQAQETIERQTKHMVHLVDDLMDISRITQGKVELRKEHILLKDILHHAVETAQPLIEKRNHHLNITLPDEPIWLNADAIRISQIFSNLLNNAAKYTDEGGQIELVVENTDKKVIISIRDNGIGIPEHMISHIFDMFLQVDNSLERSQGGLGIGLTLVKNLVKMHEGSITVHSKGLGKGSLFSVTLPLVNVQKTVTSEVQKPQQEALSSLRLLVVDDNQASAQTLGWMMEIFGHEIRLAHNGPNAIEIAHNYRPDAVLLDIGLPGMNGYDVCKAMRADPMMKDVVIIAQTGWSQDEHRRLSEEAGFNYHLVKPVDMNNLQQILSNISQK